MAKARHEVRSEAAPEEIDFAQLVTMSEDVLNIDDEAVDPSFALDSSIKSVVDHLLSNFFVKNGFLTSRQKAECYYFFLSSNILILERQRLLSLLV